MISNMKQRILYWDVIKAITIFLVIYAHGLQFFTEDKNYWQTDFICQFIISFHMPLFMIVSGYFARSIFQQDFINIVKKKTLQLFVPSVTTYFFVGVIMIFLRKQSLIGQIDNLLLNCIYSFWFLKALFIFYVFISLCKVLYERSSISLYIFIIIFMLVILNIPVQNIDFVHSLTMFPYFIIGIVFYKYKKQIFVYDKFIFIISLSIFSLMSIFWQSNEYNIYTHYIEWTTSYLLIYLVRTIIGISGSMAMILLIRKLVNKIDNKVWIKKIGNLGNATLGIYIFQYFIIARFINLYLIPYIHNMNIFNDTMYEDFFYDIVISPIISLLVLIICYTMVMVIRMNKITRLIILGEK